MISPLGETTISAYRERLVLPLREYTRRVWKSDFYDFIKYAPSLIFGKGAYAPPLIFGKGAYAPSLIFGKGADAPSPIGRGHYHMEHSDDPVYIKLESRITKTRQFMQSQLSNYINKNLCNNHG